LLILRCPSSWPSGGGGGCGAAECDPLDEPKFIYNMKNSEH
jgi:hypothetical protein